MLLCSIYLFYYVGTSLSLYSVAGPAALFFLFSRHHKILSSVGGYLVGIIGMS